jgi:predicted transcriptional regulator
MKHRRAETEEVVELTPEEIAELDDRADAVERGEFVDGDEVLRRLRGSAQNVGGVMSEHAIKIEDTFDLSPEEEADLEAAIAEADAGLLKPWEEVRRRVRENERGPIGGVMRQPIETEEEVDESPEELAELNAALEEAERGEGMDGFEFLKQLREGTWRDGSS